MNSHLKHWIRKAARTLGLEIARAKPLGSDPFVDIRTILGPKRSGDLVFFDVGANEGQTAVGLALDFPGATIYSFEPFGGAFERLVKTTARYPNVNPVPKALGEAKSSRTLFLTAFSPTNSLLHPSGESQDYLGACMDAAGEMQVEMDTLDDFCRERDIASIDLLKLDTQGYELNILRGAEEVLGGGKVHLVFVELNFVPLYEGQAFFHEVYEKMIGLDFRLVGLYDPQYRSGNYLNWCDGLFVHVEK